MMPPVTTAQMRVSAIVDLITAAAALGLGRTKATSRPAAIVLVPGDSDCETYQVPAPDCRHAPGGSYP